MGFVQWDMDKHKFIRIVKEQFIVTYIYKIGTF